MNSYIFDSAVLVKSDYPSGIDQPGNRIGYYKGCYNFYVFTTAELSPGTLLTLDLKEISDIFSSYQMNQAQINDMTPDHLHNVTQFLNILKTKISWYNQMAKKGLVRNNAELSLLGLETCLKKLDQAAHLLKFEDLKRNQQEDAANALRVSYEAGLLDSDLVDSYITAMCRLPEA